jgi:hypothetical protein
MTLPHQRVLRGSALLVLFCVVFAPARADADVPEDLGAVGDTTDEVTQTVGDTTDEVTQAVGDTTDEVTQTVGDTTDEVTQTVGDTTDEVTQTVGDTGGTTSPSVTLADAPRQGANDDSSRRGFITADGRQKPADAPGERAFESGRDFLRGVDLTDEVTEEVGDPTDPCESQPQLVCLGLLYGLGDFADGGAMVLGVVATTGIAVIGLIVLALSLATSGSALVAVSSRVAAPAGGKVTN